MYWTIAANVGIIALIVVMFITMIATWMTWDTADNTEGDFSIAVPIVVSLIWVTLLVFGIPAIAVIDSPH